MSLTRIATATAALALLVPASATAGGWTEIDATVLLPDQVNPCTGEAADVTLSLTRLRVSGEASGTVSIAARGTYSATDGSAGRFHDSDRGNVTAAGDSFVYTYRAHYLGWYEGRRQHSTYVVSVHESADGTVRVTAENESAGCSPR